MSTEILHKIRASESDLQLVCFPYLGGYANAFMQVINCLPVDAEVLVANPPGHGSSKEKPIDNLEILLDRYVIELKQKKKKPCIFLGHSMGGVVAYLLALRFQKQGESFPIKALILSASAPPCDFTSKNLSSMSDEVLLQHLISCGGIPDLLMEEISLLTHFLPVFRADAKILEASSFVSSPYLDLPVYCLWGEQDRIAPIQAIVRWSKYFKGQINLIPIQKGKHMFLHSHAEQVAQVVQNIILGV